MSKTLGNIQSKFRKATTENSGQIQRQRSDRSLSPRASSSSLPPRRTPPVLRELQTTNTDTTRPQLQPIFDQQRTEAPQIHQPAATSTQTFDAERVTQELLQTQEELEHSDNDTEPEHIMATQTHTETLEQAEQ